ncbi:MAG TPA: filamentous hemagglutinin N-terminal domain-containing protein [Candidatus Caccocola faecigallinarum]|nr:filamentous hemagglutinin N-terminal domain-containing protein [Candidatus Caccocola faecigallinarum]
MIHQRKILKAIAYAILLCFTSLTGAQPLYAIPPNTQLPVVDTNFTPIGANVPDKVTGNTMNIQQIDKTSIIKWEDFSIGADAAVNFNYNGEGGFNSLNYVTGTNAPISEIYGQLTALGGNIFIANPAGVQIGNSAQINVGSLYVTNKDIENAVGSLKELKNAEEIRDTIAGLNTGTNAQLMSLGAITNATNVTFDGARIVLDTDRIYTANKTTGELEQVGQEWFGNLHIRTTDKDNVVLGYTKDNPRGVAFDNFGIKVVDNNGNVEDDKLSHGYTWIHNLDELRAMNDDPSGWYALRNSIDANATIDNSFDPIGNWTEDQFSGRFDGLGYSIFDLKVNVTNESDAAGLFGVTSGAHIKNFTLNGGSISGGKYVGAAVGSASGGVIENITNTASVSGKGGDSENGVGGIIGYAGNAEMSGLINIGTISGLENSENVGGIVGYMSNGTLTGETYNLGSVTGGWNIGGIAGQMTNGAKIGNDGDDAFQIYNQLNVDGEYNVGGIAGTLSDSTITNAANYGDVLAKGYTTETYSYHTVKQSGDTETIDKNIENVNVANAGGIAGTSESDSKIENVVNSGNVTSEKANDQDYYKAGNVGGIVGRADNTTITNAENKENTVAGAHNVGGVAGYLGGSSTIDGGINNGGDITGTGGRTNENYTVEYYKYDDNTKQWYHQATIYEDNLLRERVRPYGENNEDEIFIVGNIGGIAGYVYGGDVQIKNSGNRGTVHSELIEPGTRVPDSAKAANVGGVVGKISQNEQDTMDNIKEKPESATVYQSYNTGNVQGYTGVGGVVGSMYNGSIARSYNLGTLRSTRQASSNSLEPLNMGGVVGDTTEDTGANAVIYDVYNAGTIGDDDYEYYGRHVGGVAGRLTGTIEKAYNTGDIYNGYSTVGGIAGWWYSGDMTNVFNTGNITVRVDSSEENARTNGSQVGGIAGATASKGGDKELKNAYNLGTIRSFTVTNGGYDPTINSMGGIIGNVNDTTSIENVYTTNNLYAATANGNTENATYVQSSVYGVVAGKGTPKSLTNAFYVKQYDDTTFIAPNSISDNVTPIINEGSDQESSYNGLSFGDGNDWRIYDGTTPILNAFTPYMKGSVDSWNGDGKLSANQIQYGTAANPLLTILKNVDGDLSYNWTDLGLTSAGGLAVYGKDGENISLTLNGFTSGGSGRYFGGTIYSDGTLTLNGEAGGDFNLGSASKLYGSSVKLNANGGDISAYGEVTSTNGNIEVSGKNVEIIGSLTAKAEGETTEIDGISGASTTSGMDTTNLNDPTKAMKSVSDMFTYTTDQAKDDGNISVEASGAAEVLYGNLGTGSVSTEGNFTVNGGVQEDGTLSGGSVYVDSDLSGTTGNINLSAGGEVLLDITNIAKANSNEQGYNGKNELHKFLVNYKEGGDNKITLDSANDDEIIAIDMWGDGTDTGSFALDKYNLGDGQTLRDAFDNLNIGNGLSAEDIVHIWISDANQLKGIQSYYDRVTETGKTTKILNYNFALKGNIDASALEDYKAIGGEAGYSGTFDGRDFRIIGLNTNTTSEQDASSGIFGKLTGTVKDLRVYASKFFGSDKESAGAIASEVTEGGKITGVTTFGNIVTAEDGAAGGIAGKNSGSILESTASDSVTASGANAYAGGVAGVNTGSIGEKGEEGESAQITADSAVRSGANGAEAIGGVVGKNETDGEVWLANSLGVTTGAESEATGGIAGTNSGTMTSLYNESIVTGGSSVGGVAGDNSGTMTNAVNATRVTGTGTNTGGLVGNNSGTVDSGRNAGTINGKDYVGGMVGSNENSGILQNLSNAIVAAITGKNYVGGIAGSNAGSITSDNNLTNEGTVSGTQYVGGIAGENKGKIENVLNETLVLKNGDGADAKYFGGIAGTNSGKITNATNNSNVSADGATIVGGIVGENTLSGELEGKLINYGDVSGESNVGGLAGSNAKDDLLKGTENDYITAENHGEVKADAGSAGGIFYENKGDIEYANLTNTGTVIGTGQANTGGLFGINNGDISNSKLTNSGTVTGGDNTGGLIGSNSGNVSNSSLINIVGAKVTGGDNTGGLIGKNSGDVSFSSLINEYGAKVSGDDNTGGLFGYNTGKITGGRNDAGTKYEHKIYNNGTVTGDSNVGGLIGNNAVGSVLTAGYNTGAVNVTEGGSGENVGGIAGTNAGIIDQVFNTVMTALGTGEKVSGNDNVGGIVGKNEAGATLSNAYNTTDVESSGTKGNIVGENSGTVKNVYATNDKGGMLIGTGNNVLNGYNYDETQKDSASYKELFEDGKDIWKIYEGYSTPLLKVFLTKAEYDGTQETLTYEAKNQSASVDFVTAFDDKAAYKNANSLLTAISGYNAGTYNAFYSGQIAASGTGDDFNPNNLGYDIDSTFTINKAKLNVTLDDIYREYGNGTMYGDKDHSSVFGSYADAIHIDFAEGTENNATMMGELNTIRKSALKGTDGAVDGRNEGQTTTNNASDKPYKWTATAKINKNLAKNYEFVGDTSDGTQVTENGAVVTAKADSYVSKADLTITLSDVQREYGGDAGTLTGGTKYAVEHSEGLTNGDEKSVLRLIADAFTKKLLKDGGLTKDGRTQNVNDENGKQAQYTWRPTDLSAFEGVDNLAQNYKVTYEGGFSTITPRKLTVTDLLAVTDYGNGAFTLEGRPTLSGIAYVEDNIELVTDDVVLSFIEGSAYDQNKNGRPTADVIRDDSAAGVLGVYGESLSVTGLTLKNNDFGNYVLEDKSTGGIKVKPVDLNITLSDVFRIYGDTKFENGTNYGLADGSVGLGANGDSVGFNGESVTFVDGGLTEDLRKTQNANVSGQTGGYLGDKRYSWNVAESDYEKVFGINPDNYNLTVNDGESKVAQRELTVSGLLASIVYGDKDGNGLKLKEGATLSGFADGYGDDSKVELVIGELTATGDYEDNRTKDNQNRATADVKTDGDGVYRDSLKAGVTLGGDSANNYYIADGTATGGIKVTPAPLTITLNDVTRIYGDAETFVNGIGYGIDDVDGLVNGDDEKQLTFAAETAKNKDKALSLTDGEWRTSDHGKYSYADGIDEAITGINLDNYEVKYKGGDSIVNKLTLKLSDLVTSIIYGDHGGQGFSDVDVTLDEGGVVYNDEVYLAGGLKITDGRFDPDGEYESDKNGRATANVGNYNQKVSFVDISLTGKDAGNYDVDGVMNAAITVTPAQLTIKADDQNMLIGTTPNFTGTTLTELANQLVNGDSLPDGFGYEFGLEDESILDLIGTHPGVIGLLLDGRFYDGGEYADWGNTVNAVFANYNVNVEPGLLTIVPPSTSNYGHLHSDGWDRVRNFRERKAEVFFHEGGMEYDEDM